MSSSRLSRLALGLAAYSSFANAAHFDVTVGKGSQLKFEPETVAAQPGDTITYSFFAKNHAVAQSTFDSPCQLQENGIFSGFTPNTSPDTAAPTTWTITVNDTKPLWFYCPQTNGNHCQSGMVHAINAPASGNTFDAYKTKALQAATPSTPSADTLPVGGLRKLHIDVGFDGNLVFNPNNVSELIGTVVEFGYNPMNHSIVQSSFDKPCQPLESGGFAAPFVPTQAGTTGTTFEITITNKDPVWFFCAQTAKAHCQAGMVGSINAATEGDKTFQAFKDLAAKAPPSTITPDTPLVGTLRVNGTLIADVGGTVLDTATLDPSLVGDVPPLGGSYSPYIGGMAGGYQPADYGWADSISDNGTEVYQALKLIIDFPLLVLLEGFDRLSQGQWTGTYPDSITNTLGSLAAQILIQRQTFTDTLQHYEKEVPSACQYHFASENINDWLNVAREGLALAMGATVDAMSLTASTDAWMVPALATASISQARMMAVINMMQGHIASPAPREALLPIALAQSYLHNSYVEDGSCDASQNPLKVIPVMAVQSEVISPDSGRLTQIKVEVPADSQGDHWVAWIGAWGNLQYTSVASDGTAAVPENMSGHVWATLTTAKDVKAREIEDVAVAGPQMLWVSQQWA
ncbi:hypothetical protein F5Y15DRAFT_15566 [Xylariaceae sp. FL0016]|nr:hypothetical protein F5Y15DRAFT_15566 [Xylariaceae sp. FL0016]